MPLSTSYHADAGILSQMLGLKASEHESESVLPATIVVGTRPLRKVVIVAHGIGGEHKYMVDSKADAFRKGWIFRYVDTSLIDKEIFEVPENGNSKCE